jgi:hypothetical protein
VNNFTRIALISLDQKAFVVISASRTGGVVKDTFGSILNDIGVVVAC